MAWDRPDASPLTIKVNQPGPCSLIEDRASFEPLPLTVSIGNFKIEYFDVVPVDQEA